MNNNDLSHVQKGSTIIIVTERISREIDPHQSDRNSVSSPSRSATETRKIVYYSDGLKHHQHDFINYKSIVLCCMNKMLLKAIY